MKHRFLKIIAVIVILAACFGPGTAGAQPAAAAATNIQYVVQPGDTLSTIAYTYCTTWQIIYDMNKAVIGPDPNVLYAGTVLTVPANCSGGGTATPPPSGVYDRGPMTYATGTFQDPYYTVAWGDTLFGIGTRFGLSYQSIMEANNMTSEMIYAGQVLYIPGTATGTPPGTTPPPTNGTAERVYFAYGATSATRYGTIQSGVPKTYVLTAFGGQTMTVTGRSHAEPLKVSIANAAGQPITVSGTNSAVDFNVSAALPATNDYFVTFTPVSQPESPTLTFDVTFIIK